MAAPIHRMHSHSRPVSRTGGGSTISALAYNLRADLHDERLSRNFTEAARGIGEPEPLSGWILPEGLADDLKPAGIEPKAVQDWWNAYEAGETARLLHRHRNNPAQAADRIANAKTALAGRFSLSNHIPRAMLRETVEEILRKAQAERHGTVSHYAIHLDKDQNAHVHYVMTRRKIGPDGIFGKNFERSKKELSEYSIFLRKTAAEIQNKKLKELGIRAHVEWRSNKKLGLELKAKVRVKQSTLEKLNKNAKTATPDAAAEANFEAKEFNAKIIQKDPAILTKLLLLGHTDEMDREQEGILSRDFAVFTKAEAERAANQITGNNEPVFKEVWRQLLESGDLIKVGEDKKKQDIYTTKKYYSRETNLINDAKALRERGGFETSQIKADEVLSGQFAFLSAEQKAAIRHMTGNEGIALVQGAAGVGKTTMMKAAAEVWKDKGFRVRGAAIAWKAARNLSDEAGFEASSIASIVIAEKLAGEVRSKQELARQKGYTYDKKVSSVPNAHLLLQKGDVLVIDEAGMVDVASMAILADAAKRAGAKIVAIGDSEQFAAIGAGAAFAGLQKAMPEATAKVEAIQRQSADLEDVLAAGGMDRRKAAQVVREMPEARRIETLQRAADRVQQIDRGKEPGATIWRREAAKLLYQGEIAAGIAEFDKRGHLKSHQNTDEAIKSIINRYFELKDNGEKNQAIYAFMNTDVDSINKAIHDKLKSRGEISTEEITVRNYKFSVGDKIIFEAGDLKGDKIKSTGGNIVNGDEAQITSIDFAKNTIKAKTTDGREVIFNAAEYKDIRHAYAMTLYKSQGQTIDGTVHILADNCLKRDGLYVALTRSKQQTEINYSEELFETKQAFISSVSRKPDTELARDISNVESKSFDLINNLIAKNKALIEKINEIDGLVKRELAKGSKISDIRKLKEYENLSIDRNNLAGERRHAARTAIVAEDRAGIATACRISNLAYERVEEMAGTRRRASTIPAANADALAGRWLDAHKAVKAGQEASKPLRDALALALVADPEQAEAAVLRLRRPSADLLTEAAIRADIAVKATRPPPDLQASWQAVQDQAKVAKEEIPKEISLKPDKRIKEPIREGFNNKEQENILAYHVANQYYQNNMLSDITIHRNSIYFDNIDNVSINISDIVKHKEVIERVEKLKEIEMAKLAQVKLKDTVDNKNNKDTKSETVIVTDKNNSINNKSDNSAAQGSTPKGNGVVSDTVKVAYEFVIKEYLKTERSLPQNERKIEDVFLNILLEKRKNNEGKMELKANKTSQHWFKADAIKAEINARRLRASMKAQGQNQTQTQGPKIKR